MKTRIQCPCGETIVGKDEDELVELTNAHLADQHDGRTDDRDMILMMATVPDTATPRRPAGGGRKRGAHCRGVRARRDSGGIAVGLTVRR